jgi:hypothetical protein
MVVMYKWPSWTNGSHSYQILIKFNFFGQIFEEKLKNKFHDNPPSDGQADIAIYMVTVCNVAMAPTNKK